MPITYRVDESLRIIFVTLSGTVTAEDYRELWKRYASDPEVLQCCRSLSDWRGAGQVVRGAELRRAVESLPPAVHALKWWHAVVADTPEHLETARELAEAPLPARVEVFAREDAAVAWLVARRFQPKATASLN